MADSELTHTAGYPLGKRLSAKHEGTFGRMTLKERLPKVLTQIIDTIHRHQEAAVAQHGVAGREAVKSVLSQLSELRYRMQTDKEMVPITSGRDTQLWERAFEAYRDKLGEAPHWFSTSWMFFECYMYRKVIEILQYNEYLRDFDPFKAQKEAGFFSSLEAMSAVGEQVVGLTREGREISCHKEQLRAEFEHLLMLCLWGNKADLSMSATMDSYDTTHHVGAMGQTAQLQPFILADHSDQLWELLSGSHDRLRVDIVLDNAGFELFCDLCFAEWLLTAGLASQVLLHCKHLPWFISDSTQRDVHWTLDQLSSSAALNTLGHRWKGRLKDGSFLLTDHPFWTTSYEYAAMKGVAPDLYSSLEQSQLVVFKGDLNYRKLVGDRNWRYMEPFSEALQGFHPTNLCTLRTLKADLVAGLPEGTALRAASECREWMIMGKYAVLQVYRK